MLINRLLCFGGPKRVQKKKPRCSPSASRSGVIGHYVAGIRRGAFRRGARCRARFSKRRRKTNFCATSQRGRRSRDLGFDATWQSVGFDVGSSARSPGRAAARRAEGAVVDTAPGVRPGPHVYGDYHALSCPEPTRSAALGTCSTSPARGADSVNAPLPSRDQRRHAHWCRRKRVATTQ